MGWGVQLVHWVRVYVKVNLIRLIKEEHSGLNKLVDGSQREPVRAAVQALTSLKDS